MQVYTKPFHGSLVFALLVVCYFFIEEICFAFGIVSIIKQIRNSEAGTSPHQDAMKQALQQSEAVTLWGNGDVTSLHHRKETQLTEQVHLAVDLDLVRSGFTLRVCVNKTFRHDSDAEV